MLRPDTVIVPSKAGISPRYDIKYLRGRRGKHLTGQEGQQDKSFAALRANWINCVGIAIQEIVVKPSALKS